MFGMQVESAMEMAPSLFLIALQSAQAASDRLLCDLEHVDMNLQFWQHLLDRGSSSLHSRFQLLSMGPSAFIHSLVEAVYHWLWGGELPTFCSLRGKTATEKLQYRVMVLKQLKEEIAVAVAGVHHAAGSLRKVVARVPFPDLYEEDPNQQRKHTGFSAAMCEWELKAAVETSDSCASSVRAALDGLYGAIPGLSKHRALERCSMEPTTGSGDSLNATELNVTASLALALGELGSCPDLKHCYKLLDVDSLRPAAGGGVSNVEEALLAAQTAAAEAGPFIQLPAWLVMPSYLQRNWLTLLMKGAGMAWVLQYIFWHSSLAGSNDLQRWSKATFDSISEAWQAHVVEPFKNIKGELFRTFRDRPSLVSAEEYESDMKSLIRMLVDFERDKRPSFESISPLPFTQQAAAIPTATNYDLAETASTQATRSGASLSSGTHVRFNDDASSMGGGSSSNNNQSPLAAGARSSVDDVGTACSDQTSQILSGMQLVMRSYEMQLRSPIRNLLVGDLARAMLIQVQRLKLDTEAAMLKLDQILKASELSFSLVAALPGMAATWLLVTACIRTMTSNPPDLKRQATFLRLAASDLERALQTLIEVQNGLVLGDRRVASDDAMHSADGRRTAIDDDDVTQCAVERRDTGGTIDKHEGMMLYKLARVQREVERLFLRHDRVSRHSHYQGLKSDVLNLAELISEGRNGAAMAPAVKRVMCFCSGNI
ncbi:hypothetical protein CEUSTIGMA_g527.t1 [Chlamydomonas eustigma]|uniref:Uncharacterized protein n=1 Tax=Chlamydomonas eustigma TaxID=1157962 RepID=A0A250WQE4_9CHLO|nr:hypothetical protein CEUSTIGMA_g527.t1 [Chlamydomonas eustigma]|eukprot:GAX73074.1 hypothetical protein CEUSTIGMA_g527.t1 [Chlamydomonas eustigma]